MPGKMSDPLKPNEEYKKNNIAWLPKTANMMVLLAMTVQVAASNLLKPTGVNS